ncbi:hypothetical protein F5883DRAFT_708805 [Diaporthe sp. PMI_573]|nr:hypothetical protein F5883DRAFT_708805 [Diaporthaceae sp. PMI_573]
MLEPAVLLLSGQHVVSKAEPEVPLYETSRDVTSIPQKNSSIIFERVEQVNVGKADTNGPEKLQKRHIFYLAHPAGAQFQTDTPAYYITSVSREEAIGNVSLRSKKSRFKKSAFEAVLSAARTAADKPLFDDENARVIFSVRPKVLAGRYTWLDSDGGQVAVEEQKGSQHTLGIVVPMTREMRDALVATWCLKVWRDTAESPHAKKDALERLTPAEGMLGYGNMSKAGKRVGALGSLAGAG